MSGRGSPYWTSSPPPSAQPSQPPAQGSHQIDMPGFEPPWFDDPFPGDINKRPIDEAMKWIREKWPDYNNDGVPDDPRGGGYIPPDVNVGWGTPSPGLPPGGGIHIPPWGLIPPIAFPPALPRPGQKSELIEAPDEGYEILRTPWGRMPVPLYIDANWLGGGMFSNYNNGFGTIGGAFIE